MGRSKHRWYQLAMCLTLMVSAAMLPLNRHLGRSLRGTLPSRRGPSVSAKWRHPCSRALVGSVRKLRPVNVASAERPAPVLAIQVNSLCHPRGEFCVNGPVLCGAGTAHQLLQAQSVRLLL